MPRSSSIKEEMAKVKDPKLSVEEEMTTLKKHFGGIVATVRDLRRSVEALEKKLSAKENQEIREIMETQKVIEEVMKIIKKEIVKMEQAKYNEASNNLHVTESRAGHKDVLVDVKVDVQDKVAEKKKPKKCRYYDRGYCKYKTKCRFTHLLGLCSQYLQTENVGKGNVTKSCKWDNGMHSC